MSIKNAVANQRRDDFRKFKAVVAKRQRDFVETGTALGLIRKDALYKEGGFASFEEFVESEFDMPRSTAYRLVDAARVVTILSQVGTIQSKITNQSQALQLAPLGKDRDAMIAVIEAAEQRSARLTAAVLEEVRGELYPHVKVIEGELADPPLVAGMRAAIESAEESQKKAAAVVPPAADGEPASSAPPPAAGVGAPQEAGRPAPAVTPTETPGDSRPGGEGDVSASPAAPPPAVEGSTQGDETEAEMPADASPQQDTAEVDGWEQQETAGVLDPAAPTPDQPVELIEWMADLYELVDTDVHGPLLTDEQLGAIGASLDRISGVVELLTTWYVRAQQQ